MPKFVRTAALLAGCALALPLASCAHGGKHAGDTAYVARDVNTLYTAAKKMMELEPGGKALPMPASPVK